MSKVRFVLQYYTEGVSKQSISKRVEVSRNTVKKYVQQFIALGLTLEQINAMTDSALEQLFKADEIKEKPKRFTDLLAFFPEMEKALKRRGMTREKQWLLYIQRYPDGYGRTQFKDYYSQWTKHLNTSMHIEHKAGDKMFVDFTGEKLSYINRETGEIIKVEVFISVLGCSQLTYVEAVRSQQKEDFIMACENALHYYGGSPLAIVPDNLKSAVIKSDRYEPRLNEMFRDFVSHYQMTALPAGPYKPKHKALVEGAVKLIYQAIFTEIKTDEHYSLESLNEAISKHLEIYNNRLMKNRSYSRRQLFEDAERIDLQSLPAYRYQMKERKLATVQKNNYVCLSEDRHYYSVPYRYVGKKVALLYNQLEVEIFYRYDCIAKHKRNYKAYGYSTIGDHLASAHKYPLDWTPEKFIDRAEKIGIHTRLYIIKLLDSKQHQEQSFKSCQGVLSYAVRVGEDRLNKACQRALFFGDISYNAIRAIIEKGLDQVDVDFTENHNKMPNHPNIRGDEYYN